MFCYSLFYTKKISDKKKLNKIFNKFSDKKTTNIIEIENSELIHKQNKGKIKKGIRETIWTHKSQLGDLLNYFFSFFFSPQFINSSMDMELRGRVNFGGLRTRSS